MGITLNREVIANPFFAYDKSRLYRFIGLWFFAVERNDPSYEPYPEDDNPRALELALNCGWVIERRGRRYLTGPERKTDWLRKTVGISTYVVEAVGTGTVKIGKSRNVASRIATLQTSSSQPLRLLAIVHSDVEKLLHNTLAAHRVSGEWFRLVPEVQQMIDSMERVDA